MSSSVWAYHRQSGLFKIWIKSILIQLVGDVNKIESATVCDTWWCLPGEKESTTMHVTVFNSFFGLAWVLRFLHSGCHLLLRLSLVAQHISASCQTHFIANYKVGNGFWTSIYGVRWVTTLSRLLLMKYCSSSSSKISWMSLLTWKTLSLLYRSNICSI